MATWQRRSRRRLDCRVVVVLVNQRQVFLGDGAKETNDAAVFGACDEVGNFWPCPTVPDGAAEQVPPEGAVPCDPFVAFDGADGSLSGALGREAAGEPVEEGVFHAEHREPQRDGRGRGRFAVLDARRLPQRASEAFHEERGGEGAQIAPSVRAQESDVQQGA